MHQTGICVSMSRRVLYNLVGRSALRQKARAQSSCTRVLERPHDSSWERSSGPLVKRVFSKAGPKRIQVSQRSPKCPSEDPKEDPTQTAESNTHISHKTRWSTLTRQGQTMLSALPTDGPIQNPKETINHESKQNTIEHSTSSLVMVYKTDEPFPKTSRDVGQ